MTERLPSIPQMRNRANGGHAKALARIAAGEPILGPGAFASEIRGMRTVLGTLRRWECVEPVGDHLELTTRGAALLTALTVGVR